MIDDGFSDFGPAWLPGYYMTLAPSWWPRRCAVTNELIWRKTYLLLNRPAMFSNCTVSEAGLAILLLRGIQLEPVPDELIPSKGKRVI